MSNPPHNLAVIIAGEVFRRECPVLYVFHDADDGGWQFIGRNDPDVADANVVALSVILREDPTLREIMTFPEGFVAWRESWGADWHVEPNPRGEE